MRVDVQNAGEIGIIPDTSDDSIPANAWTDGINVKQKNGAMYTVNGRLSITNDPTIQPKFLMPLDTTTTDHWMYAGWDSVGVNPEIWSIDVDGNHANRTPAGLTSTEHTQWFGTQYGDLPILTNGIDYPVYWDGSPTLVTLTDWPANTNCKVLVSFNGYLVAANMTESGVPNERLVRWSNTADPGSLPDSWDYTDPTVEAGRTELAENGGAVLDAVELNGILFLYREKSTYAMQWVRGTYVFNFRQAFSGWGVIGRHCAQEFAGRHWVFADSDIISHNGTQIESLITQKQRDHIFKSIDIDNKGNSFVVINNQQNEVWFCYPELGDTYATKAFTYNVLTGESGFRAMPECAHGASGVRFASSILTWDSQVDVWDDMLDVWDTNNQGTSKYSVVSCSPTNMKIYLEDVGLSDDGSDITATLERENLQLPNTLKGSACTILDVRPYADNVGTMITEVQVGSQRTKHSGLSWSAKKTFDPESQYKVSFRQTGRHPAIRYTFTGKGSVSLNAYSVDLQSRGSR